ncbi:MAG: hypothetical protein GXO86_04025, partial [Chlorobi bacterium]|nr:hypothetical protein [Chlorobiota bacterium]
MRQLIIPVLTIFLSGFTYFLLAQNPPVADQQLGVFEHLDEYISDDLVFTDEKYEKINIRESLDKPTVLALVYYECPGICSPLLNGLAEAMDKTDINLGKEYQVYTISFSPAEKPPLAGQKKKTYAR